MTDNQSLDFKHHLFFLNCIVAAVALTFIAILESQPNFVENLLNSIRLIDAIIFAAFGIWSRTGRVLAPFMLLPYSLYLVFDQRLADSPYQYAAMGVYAAVIITAGISLHASWKAATAEQQTETKTEE